MANIEEWAKGISVFLIITLLTYFAYENIISGLLAWATESSAILGAIGWVSFILLYLVSAPGYMMYAILVGSKEGKTRPGYVLLGYSVFFLMLIVAVAINMVMSGTGGEAGLIDSLDTATATMIDDTTSISQISFLAVLITVLGCIGAPFGLILYGYGKIGGQQEET